MEQTKKTFKNYIKGLWIATGIFVVGMVIFFWLIAFGKLGFMPSFEELENPKNIIASEIISSDKQLIGKFYLNENRTIIEYDDINPNVVHALISTEDERYYNHSGIDLRALFRVVKGVVTRDSRGGGSTISQQLSKLLFPRGENNSGLRIIVRKFREWVIAVKLERSYTKEEIIAMYLNKFEFINGAFGLEVAAQTYFNTSADSLKVNEAAVLVGMLKNPWLYNPKQFPDRSFNRRNTVYAQMMKNHYLNREQFDSLKIQPLDLKFNRDGLKKGMAPYFRKYLETRMRASQPIRSQYGNSARSIQKYNEDSVAWVSDPLFGWCNKNIKPDGKPYELYKDGIKIYTTVDYRMQNYAEQAVKEHLLILQPQLNRNIRNLRYPPFSNDLSKNEVDNILMAEIMRSHRYQTLKKKGYNNTRILKEFNQKDTLLIYTWEGYKDTIMSPLDSIKHYLKTLSSSFMAMDPNTGEVKAWVGGAAYGFTEIDMVRSSTYKRQVGSTCKPFLYTLAIKTGVSPCDLVPNIPQTFPMPDGTDWTARNSGSTEYDGKMATLKWGLANSVNQISAWLMKQFNPIAMKQMMRKMGIYSEIDAVPSMFLGTSEITLHEMVAAYAVFANAGVYTTPIIVSKIEDKNGNLLSTFKPERYDAIDEYTAYTMTKMLQNVVAHGSGVRLRLTYDVYEEYGGFDTPFAGKTGTTQEQSDGWFIGFTPELVAGCWTGANYRSIHFDNITQGQGANVALPVFGRFFKKVFADSTLNYSPTINFDKPAGYNFNFDCDEQNSRANEFPAFDTFF